jgi:GR25 family glycosyltransferase involved in LPS biosynthesis
MEAQCKKLGVILYRLEAVTKKEAEQVGKLDLRSANNLKFNHKSSHLDLDSWGSVGAFLSHRKAWQLILDNKWEKAWVLEDDCILTRIEDVKVDNEHPFVWLGLRGSPKTYTVSGYPYKVLNYDRECYGAHGYCLHSSLIPQLLNSTTLSLAADYFINEFLFFKGIRVGLTDIAYTNEFLSFSDIDHTPIGKPKSRLWIWIGLVLIITIAYLLK